MSFNHADPNFMTLSRFLLNEQRKFAGSTGELTHLINSIQCAIKVIAAAVQNANSNTVYGLNDKTDKSDKIEKLDKMANDVFVNMLSTSYSVSVLLSQKRSKSYIMKEKERGKYIVCFDPIDGLSNIECMGVIGSIFSILHKTDELPPNEQDLLRPGTEIAAAGYAIYGTSTAIILSLNLSVNCFTLDVSIGEFILTDFNMKMPMQGNIYSTNEGYSDHWIKGYKDYMRMKKDPSKGKINILRYTGSIVGDVHRLLTYGGIFLYPATKLSPNGKLNLLCHCIPMSYIVTCAGGLSSNGDISILDIVPDDIQQRSELIVGSKKDVEEVLTYLKLANN